MSITMLRRSITTALSALALAGGAFLAAPSAHAAATGYTTAQLTLRAGTNTSTSALAQIPSGTALSLQCQARGQAISGTYNSDWWARVSYGGRTGYVSRAYVRVPHGQSLGTCSGGGNAPNPGGKSMVDGPITRGEVLSRAQNWVNRRVPYSMYRTAPDIRGRHYRTDCSGMVSMAFHLGTSLSTVTLPQRVYRINKDALRPGDIVGNLGPGTGGSAGHVVIFNGWTNSSKRTFRTLEQTGNHAQARVLTWGTSFYTKAAYRYNKIAD